MPGSLFRCAPAALVLAASGIALAGWAFPDAAGPPDAIENSLGMRLIRIQPGLFVMGALKGGDFDERPAHSVAVTRTFYMGATEVTNAQYERFDPDHRRLRGREGLSKGDDEPVVQVSWHDAVNFCQWLSTKAGRTYRLPTEAEWEYACRSGTITSYHTGDTLPKEYHKNQKIDWAPVPVDLTVAKTPPNAFGLFDMHGNVEEWCHDGYGPYEEGAHTDPTGRIDGDFKVTRGGSHGTPIAYLRSSNRMGALPGDRSCMIGFRVVMGKLPDTEPLPVPPPPRWAQDVSIKKWDWSGAPDRTKPHFIGPKRFVKIPGGSHGPMFSRHNHCPDIAACPNGDLLAVWYSTDTEPGRELAILASRLRQGAEEWEPAAPFWDAPDRNDHASALWWDGEETLYHFNGLSSDATWGKLALVMRTSTDSGASWSRARLILPGHGLRHMPIAGVIRTREGAMILPCDAVTGGNGGTALQISRDQGETWEDPGAGRPQPEFAAGKTGAWIAGIHAGVVQLEDGSLMALGRGDPIAGRMPMSRSRDMGRTWTYSASEFPPIGGGQRLAFMRLDEGPLFFASFADRLMIKDASGRERPVSGLFTALSFDEGKTWPVKRLVSGGGPRRELDGGAWTRTFVMDGERAEPKGYLAAVQTPDGLIHLISSALYYRFNLAWLKTPMPGPQDR